MYKVWFSVTVTTVVLATCINSGSCQSCDDYSETVTDMCAQLSRDLEKALLQDEGNLFRMRRTFFHSPTAGPVLLKVIYHITYADNITKSAAAKELPYCFTISNMEQNPNSTATEIRQGNITYGWTSAGIYTVFHPGVLNMVQTPVAFSMMRAVRWIRQQSAIEVIGFIWTGDEVLPTLHLNLHITSLSCVPSQEQFEIVLMDLNALVKILCTCHSETICLPSACMYYNQSRDQSTSCE